MSINIKEGIDNPTIICGFQGIWLVGPIVVQYLKDSMKFEEVGEIWIDSMMPIVAMANGKMIKPITLYHNKEKNILLVQSIIPSINIEWPLTKELNDLVDKTHAKEIIIIEGVDTEQNNSEVFYLTNCRNEAAIEKSGAKLLESGILFGLPSAFLIRQICPLFCIFGGIKRYTAEPGLAGVFPVSDSETAANIISFLNRHLGTHVDTTTLMKRSEEIGQELRRLTDQVRIKPEGKPSYFG